MSLFFLLSSGTFLIDGLLSEVIWMISEENYWNDAGKFELFVSQAEIDSCNTIEWSRRLTTCTIRRQRDQVVWENFENCKDESNGSWRLTLKVTEILKRRADTSTTIRQWALDLGTKKTITRNKNSKGRLELLNPNYEYWRFLLLKVQVLLLFYGAETLTDLKNSIIWLITPNCFFPEKPESLLLIICRLKNVRSANQATKVRVKKNMSCTWMRRGSV